MVARSQSRPWSPDLRLALAALAAAGAFLGAWGVLHVGFYTHGQVDDTPIYQKYGDWMAEGKVPYRDFGVEYPPGALPAFALPAAGDHDGFRGRFEALMAACGAALVGLTALSLRTLGRPLLPGLAVVSLFPLALGPVVLTRYDLWPAMLTAAAVAAIVAGRDRLGSATLGLAAAVKVFPAVLLPLVVASVWRHRGRDAALACCGWFAGVAAAVVLPFLVLAPRGVLESIGRQLSRPLQIESLGSAFLLAAHQSLGLELTMRSGHGSQNLAGSLPDMLAVLESLALAAVLAALWFAFARGPADRDRLVGYCAACVVAFVALGKVLSPQFLVWLVPLVPLVRGRRGATASALLVVAMLVTQLWFPYRYWDLALRFDEVSSWLVLVRDLVLVALLTVLVAPGLRPRPA